MHASALALAALFLTLPLSGVAAQAGGRAVTASIVGGPREGSKAPEFSLPWANKETVGTPDSPYELWRDRGKTVVLAFYPGDFTKGCTAEMQTFADQYETLFGADVVVLGVSADPLESHQRFAASLDLPFRLLSDPGQVVARRYGSNGENGYMRRTVYVVGPDGKVKYRNLRFNALDPNHYAELGAAVSRSRGS